MLRLVYMFTSGFDLPFRVHLCAAQLLYCSLLRNMDMVPCLRVGSVPLLVS